MNKKIEFPYKISNLYVWIEAEIDSDMNIKLLRASSQSETVDIIIFDFWLRQIEEREQERLYRAWINYACSSPDHYRDSIQ